MKRQPIEPDVVRHALADVVENLLPIGLRQLLIEGLELREACLRPKSRLSRSSVARAQTGASTSSSARTAAISRHCWSCNRNNVSRHEQHGGERNQAANQDRPHRLAELGEGRFDKIGPLVFRPQSEYMRHRRAKSRRQDRFRAFRPRGSTACRCRLARAREPEKFGNSLNFSRARATASASPARYTWRSGASK